MCRTVAGFRWRPNILMPSSSPDTAPLPNKRFELRHKSRRILDWRALTRMGHGLVLVAWSLLLAAWLTLHWGILPHLNDWRPRIEAQATKVLGVSVRIGRIEVQAGGWTPTLKIVDVTLVDDRGREALKLPQVVTTVSARSLLALTLRFEQMVIDGAWLDVRRDAQGRIFVAGLSVKDGSGEDGSAAADWFFDQHEFVIRHGSVRWTDERLRAPPLTLTDVDLVVRNGVKRHTIRIDATPPADWGARWSLQARFSQPLWTRSADWKRWNGTVYAQLPRADLAQLRQHMTLPFDLLQGEGGLRAWVEVERGELQAATVDAALNAVTLKLARGLEPLALERLQGRFNFGRRPDGMRLDAQDLGFTVPGSRPWPRGNLHLALTQRQGVPDAPVTGGEFNADRLDLQMMTDIAERLPLGDAMHRMLAQLQPEGEVRALSTHWEGPLGSPARYAVKARIEGLGIAAAPQTSGIGRPGWRNARVELRADERSGDATLAIDNGAMEFPGVFEEATIPLDRLRAQLAWRIHRPRAAPAGVPPQFELKLRDVHFANADAQGIFGGTWRTGQGAGVSGRGRFPGVLDLSGRLSRGQAARVARYLPLGIPATTRDYVARAVTGGKIDAADFKVKGDLRLFPFHDASGGEFRIRGHVSDVDLAYVPGPAGAAPAWPALAEVSGDLEFNRAAMDIRHARARVFGYELAQVQGGIRHLGNTPTLLLEGQGQGPLVDVLRFANASPLGDRLGQGLKSAVASGQSALKLALELPLQKLSEAKVKGIVTLLGDDLRLRPDVPPLVAQARGSIEFTHQAFGLRGVSARALGGEVAVEGGTLPDGSTRIQAYGNASAEGLRRAAEVPWLSRMAASMSGQAPYRLTLGLVKGRAEVTLTSPLTGLALDLPAPLRKPADVPLPLRVQTQLDPQGAARDSLRVEVGNVLQALYHRDLAHETPRVQSGAIGLLQPLPPPVPGVTARLNLGVFDADAWRQLTARWFGGDADSGEVTAGGYAPRHMALQAQELRLGGRRLDQVNATVAALPGGEPGWLISVAAVQLAGNLEYRPAGASGAGRVRARLSRLALPRSEVESVESLLDQAPASVPALDIVVDDFELRDKRLGRLEIEAVNQGEPGAKEWRLAKLNLGVPEAQLRASGRWAAGGNAGSRRRMVMDFKLEVSDGGALLQRLGMPGALKGGNGLMQGQVAWQGSPFALDYPSLSAQLHLGLDKGQFLKAGSGAARLLGVLSLQSLPRRLVLDFRDLFNAGFAFDNVSGDVRIREGVASTNNLRMRGVQAAVLMEGQANLERETQDLRVIVVPELNAGTASLAYAAINPAVGLGTFVAQLFLRKPLMQASTREFHITGEWDDPKVDRVERKITDPLPDMEAPSPTAAAASPIAQEPNP